jgi:hypothetical protein
MTQFLMLTRMRSRRTILKHSVAAESPNPSNCTRRPLPLLSAICYLQFANEPKASSRALRLTVDGVVEDFQVFLDNARRHLLVLQPEIAGLETTFRECV